MSQFYFNPSSQSSMNTHMPPFSAHNGHHSSRTRRGPRPFAPAIQQTTHKAVKPGRSIKEPAEATQAALFRRDFEAARSFDLEDDELFCPWHLLTEDDLQSMHSSSSDRSSSSTGSPETSPLQQQLQPTPSFSLTSNVFQQGSVNHLKIHQPMAQRVRNAIPIVDPNSRTTSPPTSISPVRQIQKSTFTGRRW